MRRKESGPLSRPFPLHRVTTDGVDADLEATPEERAALASELGLPSIERLTSRFRLAGDPSRVRVTGRIRAALFQTCVVSLDPFPASIDEELEITFVTPDPRATAAAREATEIELSAEADEPEELVGDQVDLGKVAAEFLALALDPYPRKPGVTFEPGGEGASASPFGKLAALRTTGDE